MPTSTIIDDFIQTNYQLNAEKRLILREAIRKIIRLRLMEYESFVFNQTPFDPDLVGNIMGIQFTEGELDTDISAEIKPHPDKTFKFLAIINSLIDNDQHKRFSKFHEISHVMHNIFDEGFVAFRTPKSTHNSTFFSKDPREIVCDITASELLFYYPVFKDDIENFNTDQPVSKQITSLCFKYNSSIEATARTLIENYPHKAFMMVIKEGYRKPEEDKMKVDESFKPQPKPRIQYVIINDKIKFYIPRNKSFSEDTIIHRCLKNNAIENDTVDLSYYECGDGIYNCCVLPEDDRCFFIGFDK